MSRLLRHRWVLLAAVGSVLLPATHGAGAAVRTSLPSRALTITGEAPGDQAGLQVAVGDLDGDRVDDLVVGAYANDAGGEQSGAVYIEYGPIRRGFNLRTADVKLYPPFEGDYVGEGPIGVADVDGDRADDLIIGAPGSLPATQPGSPGKVGEAYLLYGGPRLRGSLPLPDAAHARFTGIQVGEWLGFGSAGVGDMDRDGYDEFLLGAPATAAYSGAAHLFYGRKARFAGDVSVMDAEATIVGGRPGEMFGYLADGGDLDGDRASDLVVTSSPFPAPSLAAVSVFYGSPGSRLSGVVLSATAHARFETPTYPSWFPSSPVVAVDGDLTGDGTADLAVAIAGDLLPDQVPSTWIVAGGARRSGVSALDSAARTTIVGAGSSVAVGQLHGSARADIAVGDVTRGTVAVFAGPLPAGELSLAPAARLISADDTEQAGTALAVGDLTGDRRTDLVVGAPAPVTESGRVYVLPHGR